MGEPELQADHVTDMAEYLRETLAEIDRAIAELTQNRAEIATRLAVILAANDPGTQRAVDDYTVRAAENRPYETAQDASELITEALGRFRE